MSTRAGRSWSALVILLVAIFAFWWGLSVFIESETPSVITGAIVMQNTVPYESNSTVVVHHTVLNNVHTYSGVFSLPSACDTLGTGLSNTGQSPRHVTLLLSLIGTPGCAAAATDVQTFSVTVSERAGEPAPVFDGVTVNNSIVPSTLVEGN